VNLAFYTVSGVCRRCCRRWLWRSPIRNRQVSSGGFPAPTLAGGNRCTPGPRHLAQKAQRRLRPNRFVVDKPRGAAARNIAHDLVAKAPARRLQHHHSFVQFRRSQIAPSLLPAILCPSTCRTRFRSEFQSWSKGRWFWSRHPSVSRETSVAELSRASRKRDRGELKLWLVRPSGPGQSPCRPSC